MPPEADMLDLPPPFAQIALPAGADVFARACACAPDRGAGTLIWASDPTRLDIAVVLEPTENLATASGVIFAGLNALGDALAVAAPPEKKLAFVWPDEIHFELGLVGGVRLAWPDHCRPDAVPDWLVFAATLRLTAEGEPPPSSLVGEGFEDLHPPALVESFARHLMARLDEWPRSGVTGQLDSWQQRAATPPGRLDTLPTRPGWMDASGWLRA